MATDVLVLIQRYSDNGYKNPDTKMQKSHRQWMSIQLLKEFYRFILIKLLMDRASLEFCCQWLAMEDSS